MNPAYTQEQQAFLEKFYQGVTDPETRYQMLLTHNYGTKPKDGLGPNYHALKINNGETILEINHSNILLSTKIAIEEFEILSSNKLFIPDYQ